MSVNESLTAFVDTFFGDDNTAQLESLNFKFQTFTAAYNAIEALGLDRSPYTISLSSGIYLLDLNLYQNINIISTNGINSLSPVIVVPEIEISFNGVSVADSDVFFIQSSAKSFRPPLKIIGASEFTSTSNIILQNFDVPDDTLNNIITLCDKFDDIHAKSVNNNNKKLNKRKDMMKNGNIEPQQIDPEKVNYLIIIESEFECMANVFIQPLVFQSVGTEAVGFVDSRLGNIVTVPPNMSGEFIVGSIISPEKTILFVSNNGRQSVIDNYVDFILTYIEEIQGEVKNVEILWGVFGLICHLIDRGTPFLTSGQYVDMIFKSSSLVYKKEEVITNPIAESIKESVLTQIENAQTVVNNRLSSSNDVLPRIAFIDSIFTAETEKSLSNSIIDYMVDGSNISGVILPDNPNISNESIYPIINASEREGANINRGSQFVRYRCIESKDNQKTVYVHDRLDGEIFFIDASQGPIKIIIPKEKCNDGLCWKGRTITYKRIDRSCNKVKIVNKRGKFDNTTCALELKSCNDEWKLPVLKIIIAEDGNAFIL